MYLWRFLGFLVDPEDPRMTQKGPKKVKTAKFSDFYRFYANFVTISIDFVALNVERE